MIPIVALFAAMLPAAPAEAHEFTRTDGNDSPGRLDLRSASVDHARTRIGHTVRTYSSWTPASLGDDSFFVIAIDTNLDNDFELCAYIFYFRRLRGALTNCRNTFHWSLAVAKPSGTTAKIWIDTLTVAPAYRWAAFSYYTGSRPCANTCRDVLPNRFPLPMHDVAPPVIRLASPALLATSVATGPSFPFNFRLVDRHSGVGAWTVESKIHGIPGWDVIATGTGGGPQAPIIDWTSGTQQLVRVNATDKQENESSKERWVLVPFDQVEAGAGTFAGDVTLESRADAYGGSVTVLDDRSESLTVTVVDPTPGAQPCQQFKIVGPGDGLWTMQVAMNGNPTGQLIFDTHIPDAPRQVLFSQSVCVQATFVVQAVTGAVAIDAVYA